MKKFFKAIFETIEEVGKYFEEHKCQVSMAMIGFVFAPVYKSRKLTYFAGFWAACVFGIIGNRIDEIHQVAEKAKNRYWL